MSNYFLHFPDGDSMKIDTLFHDGVISVGDIAWRFQDTDNE